MGYRQGAERRDMKIVWIDGCGVTHTETSLTFGQAVKRAEPLRASGCEVKVEPMVPPMWTQSQYAYGKSSRRGRW